MIVNILCMSYSYFKFSVCVLCSFFVKFKSLTIMFCTLVPSRDTEVKAIAVLTCRLNSFSSGSLNGSSVPGHSPGVLVTFRWSSRVCRRAFTRYVLDSAGSYCVSSWKTSSKAENLSIMYRMTNRSDIFIYGEGK